MTIKCKTCGADHVDIGACRQLTNFAEHLGESSRNNLDAGFALQAEVASLRSQLSTVLVSADASAALAKLLAEAEGRGRAEATVLLAGRAFEKGREAGRKEALSLATADTFEIALAQARAEGHTAGFCDAVERAIATLREEITRDGHVVNMDVAVHAPAMIARIRALTLDMLAEEKYAPSPTQSDVRHHLLTSLSQEEFDVIEGPTVEEMRDAMERGRRAAAAAFPNGNAARCARRVLPEDAPAKADPGGLAHESATAIHAARGEHDTDFDLDDAGGVQCGAVYADQTRVDIAGVCILKPGHAGPHMECHVGRRKITTKEPRDGE
jgi:hypothetical protein